jgi:hypothetical protein
MRFLRNDPWVPAKFEQERCLVVAAWDLLDGDARQVIARNDLLGFLLAISNFCVEEIEFEEGEENLIAAAKTYSRDEVNKLHKQFGLLNENRTRNIRSKPV